MGGDDDLVLERIRKRERFRQLEEERRKERLRKACGTTSTGLTEVVASISTTVPSRNDADCKEVTKMQVKSTLFDSGKMNGASTTDPHLLVPPSNAFHKSSHHKGVSFLLENSSMMHPKIPNGITGYSSNSVFASSPSSSVTMSQPTPPDKQNGNRLDASTTSNSFPKPPPRKKISTLLDSSSEEEEEDIMKFAHRLEDRSKEQVQKRRNHPTTGSTTQPPNGSTARNPTAKRRLSVSDSDDEEDILAMAQRLEKKKRDQSVSSNTSATSPDGGDRSEARKKSHPRNPLTLMKEEDKSFEFIINEGNTESRNALLAESKNSLLWSDESELEDNRENKTRSITSPKKRKSKDPKSPSQAPGRTHLFDKVNSTNEEKEADDEEDLQKRQHPHFDHPKFGPFDPVPFVLRSSDPTSDDPLDVPHHQVPASINRYLPDYQRAGIEFLYRCGIATKGGAILGDDMGLGKTVQTISLLAALFRKSGTDLDVKELKRRRKIVENRIEQIRREGERSFIEGRMCRTGSDGKNIEVFKELALPEWSPVLIIAPNSVVPNWERDFKTWAHFNVAVYRGAGRASALESVENGITEVLICGDSTIQGVHSFKALDSAIIKWKIIVVDEFHKFKNEEKHLATNLRRMRDRHGCVVLGLTGTLMQNNHKELWNLVDIVAKDFLGPWSRFEEEYAKSIQLSRTKDASAEVVELGEKKAVELSTKLQRVYFRRTKEDTLADILPMKDERIIFCELSPLQKELYEYIIEQPDFILLRHKNAPCDCGVNKKFFLEYQHLRRKEEKIEYSRQNRHKIIPRGQCCYTYPRAADGSGVDPNAVLWRQQHPEDESCERCPSCTLFGAMHILYKLSSHAALLQVGTPPERLVPGSSLHNDALRQLERTRRFFPPHLLSKIPGGYYYQNSIMDNHFALSGKMTVLDKLLQSICVQQGRILLFSISTKTLDLIESYILSMGKYSYLRMDGQTTDAKRIEIMGEYEKSPRFVFLLSTKAMGLGLNLTQANYVILFDVDWNPSSDSQAQDRAYRIGQERNVKVFRLVARGTIEEQKYLRQVYKTQLKSETIVDVKNVERQKSSRLFRGVAGDEHRKGELFGCENLLKFNDGTFMNYASRQRESQRYGVGVYDTNALLETVKDLSEEELNNIGQEGNIFEDIANCTNENDSDDEVHLVGGMSQAVMDVCEQVDSSSTVPLPQEMDPDIKVTGCNETQSPLYDAPDSPQVAGWNIAEALGGQSSFEPVNCKSMATAADTLTTGISKGAVTKLSMRNTKVAGTTSDQIRRGEVGPTTFQLSDLFIPEAATRR